MTTVQETLLAMLQDELVTAVGCTEPATVIFTAAKVRDILGELPEKLTVQCSPSLYKNAKGVYIPNANKLMGIKMGALLGVILGGSEGELSIPGRITEQDIQRALDLDSVDFCELQVVPNDKEIFIFMEAHAPNKHVTVKLEDAHTHITEITFNGEVVYEADPIVAQRLADPFKGLAFDEIYEFADTVSPEFFEDMIRNQVEKNMVCAQDGMHSNQKLNLGNILIDRRCDDPLEKGIAYAGAGCDARMSGASVPVCTIGGSGTQSIASSVPIYVYCREKGMAEEDMLRAVLLSDFTFLYIKKGVGRLSAYCSAAVSAAAVAGAVVYLETGDRKSVKSAIINTLSNVSGILCDGAKISCALKVVTCLKGAALSIALVDRQANIDYNIGILGDDFEGSIRNVGVVASVGMHPTNQEIIALMCEPKKSMR